MEQKILTLEKVYNRSFLLTCISIVEQRYYATSVEHEAFYVQFYEPNNQESTEK